MADLRDDIAALEARAKWLQSNASWLRLRAHVTAPPAAVAAVPEVLVRAYFHRFSEVEDDYTIYHTLDGVCKQCIPVLIVRAAANKENGND